jgi:hypothetical protein
VFVFVGTVCVLCLQLTLRSACCYCLTRSPPTLECTAADLACLLPWLLASLPLACREQPGQDRVSASAYLYHCCAASH